MTDQQHPDQQYPDQQRRGDEKIVSASRVIAATPETIFDILADPNQHPRFDGNDNTQEAQGAERVRAVGERFTMLNTSGHTRDNEVVEFEEGRRIAWMPGPVGEPRPGHLWRWEVDPQPEGTLVTHTYDWTGLTDEERFERARATTADKLQASVDRLALLVEGTGDAEI